jgi:hypothetical protein
MVWRLSSAVSDSAFCMLTVCAMADTRMRFQYPKCTDARTFRQGLLKQLLYGDGAKRISGTERTTFTTSSHIQQMPKDKAEWDRMFSFRAAYIADAFMVRGQAAAATQSGYGQLRALVSSSQLKIGSMFCEFFLSHQAARGYRLHHAPYFILRGPS